MEQSKKQQFLNLLEENPELELRTVIRKLNTPLSKLTEWRKESIGKPEEVSFEDLPEELRINGTTVVTPLSAKGMETLEIDTITNEVVSATELERRGEQRKLRAAKRLEASGAGPGSLDDRMAEVAFELVDRISECLITVDPISESKEVQTLATALASLRNSFFGKSGVNVNVNAQAAGNAQSALTSFRSKLTP